MAVHKPIFTTPLSTLKQYSLGGQTLPDFGGKYYRIIHAIIPTVEREATGRSAVTLDSQSAKMKFEEVSAVEILKAPEYAYGIKIKFDKSKVSKCSITASMNSDDLYVWLQTVCDLIGGQYQANGNEIEVLSSGCQ